MTDRPTPDPMTQEYVYVIAQDRIERWEGGQRIASETIATGDEYRLAVEVLKLKRERDELRDGYSLLTSAAISLSDALHKEEAYGVQLDDHTDAAWEVLSFAIESARATLARKQP